MGITINTKEHIFATGEQKYEEEEGELINSVPPFKEMRDIVPTNGTNC
jgi:hypothetical protein